MSQPFSFFRLSGALVLLALMSACATVPSRSPAGEAFSAVVEVFSAFSAADHQRMRESVTDDFVLLEHGEVWDLAFLLGVLKPNETVRTNFFSIISQSAYRELVTVNYWTKSTFTTNGETTDRYWLESAVIKPVDGRWQVQQLHSTRLEPDVVPANVTFSSFQ